MVILSFQKRNDRKEKKTYNFCGIVMPSEKYNILESLIYEFR